VTALHPGAIAATAPDRAAVIAGDRTLGYGALDRQSAALAARLRAMGLRSGDVVALLIANRPEFLAVAWAAQRSGLYYLPVPTRATVPEIEWLLADSGAAALIVDPALAVQLPPACPAVLALEEALAPCDAPPAPALEGGDLLYTSGTTGRPKGVKRPLSLAPLGSEVRRVARGRALFGLDRDSVFLSPAPAYHAAPLRFAINLLRVGGTVVLMPRFDPTEALRTLARHRVTHSQWVPTHFARLLALPEGERQAHDLASHRVAIHSGAPCPPSVKRAMIDWWGPILHEYYSGTESIGFCHLPSAEWLARPGSVGRPYDCTVHILDEAGAELPAGATGLVYFDGGAPLSYHNDPAKSAAARSPQGWATMGDLGHVDADGYLYLTDRRAFTIISGGVNVYPREVEDALMAQTDVADCAVFGVPDADLGEAVLALVELRPGVAADAATAARLLAALRATLAGPKLPRFIAFPGALPRTETGKLDKAGLRTAWSARADRGFDAAALRAAA